MAEKFNQLLEKMSPQALASVREKTQAMLNEMPLQEFRQARGLLQLAEGVHVKQPSIAKLEKRTD